MKRIVTMAVKLGVVHGKSLIRMTVPVTTGNIFVDYYIMPGSKAYSVIKA
jgi:hypothetical protein